MTQNPHPPEDAKRPYHRPRLEDLGPLAKATGTDTAYSPYPDGGGEEAPYGAYS